MSARVILVELPVVPVNGTPFDRVVEALQAAGIAAHVIECDESQTLIFRARESVVVADAIFGAIAAREGVSNGS